MTRCEARSPDGRQCLLPTHPGRCLVAKPGVPGADLTRRIVCAWGHERLAGAWAGLFGTHRWTTAEMIADTCEWLANGGLDGPRKDALPPVGRVVGEA